MKAKPNQLKAQWSKSQKDIVFAWGEGIHKSDAHLLYAALNLKMKDGGTSLEEELLARGYDLTTLRFSVKKTRLTKRAADGFSACAGDDDQGDGIGFAEAHGW